MSEKLLVKYLSPETGEYEYASVIDIGDLNALKTTVKTDIVSAINSIEISGDVPSNIQEQINVVNAEIESLKNASLTQKQLDEIQNKIDGNIVDIIAQVNIINDKTKADLDKEIKDLSDGFDGKLAVAENDYNAKVSEINLNLSNAKQDIDETKIGLESAGERLNKIDLNYVTVTQDVSRINGELTTKVNSTDFDLMQAQVTENTTQISQTKNEIQTLATKSSLDLATDRITKAESDIRINADGISSRVTYQEMNTELKKVSKYGDNLLTGTRNWGDRWKPSNVAYTSISSDTYNHCRIQVVTNELGYYYTPVDNLEVGETYTASIYYKSKDNSQLTNIVLDDENDEYQLDTIVENTSTINGWRRVSVSFVPIEKSPTVAFKFGFLAGTDIGYLAGAKIELGVKASEWKPHYNDDNESILKNESSINQNSESIVTLVTKTERMDGDITDNRTQISQTSEAVSLQATKISEIDGKVSENTASLVVANDAINTKVSQTDVDDSIANINLDTKNRILNSDFSREWNDWVEKNDGYSIQKIDGVNFAHISRTSLTNVSIAPVASAKFQVSNNEKLNFSFMFMADSVSGLDDKNIFTIELFDISDVRVMSKTFNTSELATFPALSDGKVSKLSGKYVVNRSDVAKARVKIQLNKNGSVYFSKIYLQKGDVKESEWSVAPEDLELYRTEMQTEINQNSEKIELRATKTEMDEANRSIQQNTADIILSNDKIEQVVTDYTAIDGRVSENTASLVVANDAINTKVSSTDVENILTGKAYATKSELTQTSNSLTSTISGVQSNVDALGVHTAYAYSADGTDRFTTVYPNLNLLDGTKDFSGTWEFLSAVVNDGFYNGFIVKSQSAKGTSVFKRLIATRDGDYTFSAWVSASEGQLPSFIIAKNRLVQANVLLSDTAFDWTRVVYTLKNVKEGDELTGRVEKTSSIAGKVSVAGHKWEYGSTATIWMPSESEVTTADYPTFRGTKISNKYNSSQNPEDYEWVVFKREDGISPINVVILSSNGYQFKNGNINSSLKAILYQNNREIDPDGKLYSYVWSKVGIDGKQDVAWNLAHSFSSKQLNITAEDIWQKATFNCMVEPLN